MFAEINYESLALFGKFGDAMLGLLLIVWLIALLTPKAAKLIDRLLHRKSGGEPNPARVEDSINEENYKVYSIFEDRPKGTVNGAVNNDKEENKNG